MHLVSQPFLDHSSTIFVVEMPPSSSKKNTIITGGRRGGKGAGFLKNLKESTCSSDVIIPISKTPPKKAKPRRPQRPLGPLGGGGGGGGGLVSTSLPSLSFLEKWAILTSDFYKIDALDLAPRLLGKHLRRDHVVLMITEVEAYRPNDSACHARFGITPRTAPVFGPGGNAYVYLCYGLHTMLNIVADKEGVGAAVLVRSCAPVYGLETIQMRRGMVTDKPVLLAGPGKVGQALGISTEWSNHPLFTPGDLELLDGPEPENIVVGPRVGIDYAEPEHVSALWRFAIAGTPWISAPKNTLRPPPLAL